MYIKKQHKLFCFLYVVNYEVSIYIYPIFLYDTTPMNERVEQRTWLREM